MKAAVLVFPGINRERDMARTLRLISGHEPAVVWHAETAAKGAGWAVTLQGRQEQRNYRLSIPVSLHLASGKVDTRDWQIEGSTATAVFETAEKPLDVTLNDDLTSLVILKRMKAR